MPVTKSGSFNGTTSSMSVANYTGNAASFSVSVWVYLNANQTTRTIFSDYQATGPKGWNVGIDNTTNNKLKFFLGGNTLNSVTLLANTTWYHLVFTYDGTTAKIYINGSSTPDNSLVSALVYTTVPANNYIGSLVGASEFFNGLLGAVGYWSKALSTTEIASLYNSGKGLAFADLSGSLLTSLVSYHDFLNSGSQGLDSTANAHNFTATNVTQAGGPVSGNIRVSQMGVLVVDTANPNIRMSQVGVLIVDQGTPNVRLSQFGLSVIYTANPNVRVSQSGILTIYTVTPKVRDSQTGALVIATGSPKVRDSQIGALVVVVTASAARISQEGTLVVYQGTPKARVSQAGTLVVYQIPPYLDFTFTTLTTAIGAGTPSRAISLTLFGFNLTLGSNASFALSDGGVGGVFFPASPIVIASGSGPGTVSQFVYTAPVGTTGTVTLTATCTGGLTSTKTLSLPIGTATVFIRDALTGTSGTLLDAHTPDIGGAWVRQANAATARYSLNGVGGIYQSVAVAAGNYSSYLNATQAATTEYDVQATWIVKDTTYLTAPMIVTNGNSGSATLNMYVFDAYNNPSGQGYYLGNMASGAFNALWGPVNSPTVTPGTYIGLQAIRTINGNQYIFNYSNNTLIHVPLQNNLYNSRYVGFCTNTVTTSAQTPTNGVQVGDFYARNTDWSVSAPPGATGAAMLMCV